MRALDRLVTDTEIWPSLMEADKAFRGIIGRITYEEGLPQSDLAGSIGISQNTLTNRLKDPGSLSLDELRALDAAYHLRDAEILAAVRGVRA